jgi:inward rectifier potassium channel
MLTRKPKGKVVQFGARTILAKGLPQSFWKDLHHYAMTASWPRFFGALALGFVCMNLFFSSLYALGAALGDDPISDTRPGSLVDYFFFSVETLATVGYGDMHPKSFYGHCVATLATFVGVSSVAIVAGATFGRFAQPRARLLFANNLVIGPHDGARMLMVRFGNERLNAITEASAQLWLIREELTAEGSTFRKFHRLRLTRDENPIFAFTWTLMHPLDEESPLHGWRQEEFDQSSATLVVIFSGHDENSAQVVRGRQVYATKDVRVDHVYVDIATTDGPQDVTLDYANFHDTAPIAAASPPL